MKFRHLLLLLALQFKPASASAATLQFGGHEWTVKSGFFGPGPNYWDDKNAFVDKDGAVHLKITQRDGKWYCAELNTTDRMGFGRYQFQTVGRIDQLDENVILGLFNYPTPDVGPDGTHEIDIEFSHWGNPKANIGNYTIWAPKPHTKPGATTFPFTLTGDYTTHRFIWSAKKITLQSLHGHRDDDQSPIINWTYEPADPDNHIPQKSLRLHLNLWLFHGHPPHNGQPVEIILKSFKFTPE